MSEYAIIEKTCRVCGRNFIWYDKNWAYRVTTKQTGVLYCCSYGCNEKAKKVAKGLREYNKVMGKVRKYLNDYGLMPEDRMNELLLMINNAEYDLIIDGPELTSEEKRERKKEITSMKRMYDTASTTASDYRRLDTWFNTEYISIFG